MHRSRSGDTRAGAGWADQPAVESGRGQTGQPSATRGAGCGGASWSGVCRKVSGLGWQAWSFCNPPAAPMLRRVQLPERSGHDDGAAVAGGCAEQAHTAVPRHPWAQPLHGVGQVRGAPLGCAPEIGRDSAQASRRALAKPNLTHTAGPRPTTAGSSTQACWGSSLRPCAPCPSSCPRTGRTAGCGTTCRHTRSTPRAPCEP